MSPTAIPGNLILQSPTANDPLLDLNTQPSLDLQFATSKTLNDRVSGQNLITFSRSTTGTYVDSNGIIQTAAIDAPRFDHDPTTGESLGLLIEESRTNKLINSSTFSSGYTVSADASIISSAAVAPDGTITAPLLYPLVNTLDGTISKVIGSVTSASYTVSVFAKSAGKNWIKLRNAQGNFSAWFNLDTGTAGTVTNENIAPYFTTSAIENFGNGWYRCSVKATVTYNGFTLSVVDGDNSSSVTANETNGVYIWGAQLEAGAFPTSYIPTSGSTVTRAADVASITGSNFSRWYNQSEGTVFASLLNVNRGGSNAIWSFDNGTSSQRMIFRIGNGLVTTGFSTISDTASPYTATHSFAIATNYLSGAKDGVLYPAVATTSSVPVATQLQFGTSPGLNRATGTISRLTYYPYRLPDATLQEITS